MAALILFVAIMLIFGIVYPVVIFMYALILKASGRIESVRVFFRSV